MARRPGLPATRVVTTRDQATAQVRQFVSADWSQREEIVDDVLCILACVCEEAVVAGAHGRAEEARRSG